MDKTAIEKYAKLGWSEYYKEAEEDLQDISSPVWEELPDNQKKAWRKATYAIIETALEIEAGITI